MNLPHIPTTAYASTYAYRHDLNDLAERLRYARQRKRDLEGRIFTRGETPKRLAGVERLTAEIAELQERYERMAAER